MIFGVVLTYLSIIIESKCLFHWLQMSLIKQGDLVSKVIPILGQMEQVTTPESRIVSDLITFPRYLLMTYLWVLGTVSALYSGPYRSRFRVWQVIKYYMCKCILVIKFWVDKESVSSFMVNRNSFSKVHL